MKTCLRCSQDAEESTIGAALANFVCDTCRLDVNEWTFKDTQIQEMEYQTAEPRAILLKRLEKVNVDQYR
jgi:hypothetical protein